MIKKILVPVDFSLTSVAAFGYALMIAKRYSADLTLYHAWIPPLADPLLTIDEQQAYFINEKKDKIKRLQSMCSDAGQHGVLCSYEIDENKPVEGTLLLVKDDVYDLVVMGTRGLTEDRSTWMGTNTASLIAHAHIPVLAVPHGRDYSGFKNLLIALDEELPYKQDWLFLAEWIEKFHSKVSVVHISETDTDVSKENHWLMSLEQKLVAQLPVLKGEYTVLYNDSIIDGLIHAAEESQADMLVMFRRERSFFSRIINGSITREMAGVISTPLLAIPVRA